MIVGVEEIQKRRKISIFGEKEGCSLLTYRNSFSPPACKCDAQYYLPFALQCAPPPANIHESKVYLTTIIMIEISELIARGRNGNNYWLEIIAPGWQISASILHLVALFATLMIPAFFFFRFFRASCNCAIICQADEARMKSHKAEDQRATNTRRRVTN